MKIGINGAPQPGVNPLESLRSQIEQAHADGFGTFWSLQIFGVDTLTAFAVVGQQVPDIKLGTAVVPTFPRHPMMLAQQAMTVNLATNGRLRLGIGLSHKIVVEGMWGMSFARPLRHMDDYLSALVPLMEGEQVDVSGKELTTHGKIDVPGVARPEVLVAALGEQMLELSGRKADGTITWMTGPKTLASHIVPVMAKAAEAAGRPAPQVNVSLPIVVTDDPAAARQRADKEFVIYGQLPSYRAMMDREGAAGPGDLLIAGDEAACAAALDALATAGATEFLAVEFGVGEDRARTRAFLKSQLTSR
jgi:5,10-methylenetetrahydromethanopterin reductase